MNLMDDARSMIIVSPYNKVADWRKLRESLEKLKDNAVPVDVTSEG